MFAEFELVYHNQYHKAYSTAEKLGYAKKLWFNNLCDVDPKRILDASHRAIRESEYLPTIRGILKYCEPDDTELGLPDSHSAYLEACRAPSPKAKYDWSHPAVYHAGKACDWFFLANSSEANAYPLFRRHYDELCQRLRRGEQLPAPTHMALPKEIHQPLDPEQQKEKLREMRRKLNI
ncbi:hypothetical protein IB286_03030 [Spongiibacter sp. KMU-158]|uniref:Uncharacterized protein n=2 Tax=Spongiibacter pelagi TaxID=2760804 RepID=A0A927C1K9_9GAMM|nr:hypothetical protein [Spongiibacter pelagi]